jgi:hypothetical protein
MTRYLEIKPGSISEVAKKLREDYEAYFKKELEKAGKTIPQMTDAEKKAFFNRVDKGYNAKNEQDNIKKEATSQDVSPSLANKPIVTTKTALVAAPGGKEKVIRIPIEKLADYKAKGYVEAEEFVPEETVTEEPKNAYAIGMAAAMKATGDKPPLKKSTIIKAHDIAKKIEKNEELTAAQKKLPPALQKAIEKKEKNEDTDADKMNKKQKDIKGEKEPVKFAKYQESKEEVEEACWTGYKKVGMKKKGDKMVPNCVPEEKENITEAGMKAIDTDNQELKRLRTRLTQLRDSEKAAGGEDTTNIEKQIHQTRGAILDLQKKQLQKQEDIDADKMNKKQKEVKGEKEPIKKIEEAAKKPNYKKYKKSLKKEEENLKNMKSTLTGKPVTKIDVEPKLAGHN